MYLKASHTEEQRICLSSYSPVATFNVPRNPPNEWIEKTAHPIKNKTMCIKIQRVHPSISSKLNPQIQQMICLHPWSCYQETKWLINEKELHGNLQSLLKNKPENHQKFTKILKNSTEASSGNAHWHPCRGLPCLCRRQTFLKSETEFSHFPLRKNKNHMQISHQVEI